MTQDTEQHGSGALVAVGEARSALNYGIGEGLSTHTHTVGVIIPPPDIRAIADKTAQFVAKNGVEFEKRILANEANNAKFNFLKPDDPYHAYYQHKIKELSTPETDQPSHPPEPSAPPPAIPPPPTQQQKPILPPTKPLEPPSEEHYTIHIPEGITLLDLDIIKLTAQFVARNGKSFLTGLTTREHTNPQFNFLKPTHSLFTFFTSLCDAYSRVLMPPKTILSQLKKDTEDRSAPLQRALARLEFIRMEDKEAQDAADMEEKEKIAMQTTDWHDFVIVETIDFLPGEEKLLPAPLLLKDILQQARASQYIKNKDDSGMDDHGTAAAAGGGAAAVEMTEEERRMIVDAQKPLGQVPLPPQPQQQQEEQDSGDVDMDVSEEDEEEQQPLRIVKNYKRQDHRAAMAASYDPTKHVISPITGELVPIEHMAEHMRISLLDPKWKEQKERMMDKIKETTKASDEEIGRNLSLLARTRPDVFGSQDGDAVSFALNKQIEEERSMASEQQDGDGREPKKPRV